VILRIQKHVPGTVKELGLMRVEKTGYYVVVCDITITKTL